MNEVGSPAVAAFVSAFVLRVLWIHTTTIPLYFSTQEQVEAEKAELTYSGSEGAISLFSACFH